METVPTTARNSISIKIGGVGPFSIMNNLWQKLFYARCEDLSLRPNEKQMKRFIKSMDKHTKKRRLQLSEMGMGSKSAQVLGQIIRIGSNINEWIHIDLSMNKLGANIAPIVQGLKHNTKLVSLKLSNNEIGGAANI